MPRASLPIHFQADGHRVRGETLHSDAGAAVFVLTSCSAELGLELRSVYLAAEGRDDVLVAESAVLGRGPAGLGSRLLTAAGGALVEQRRRLLYDHLQRLQDLAMEGGFTLLIEGVDAAAAELDPFSPQASPSGV